MSAAGLRRYSRVWRIARFCSNSSLPQTSRDFAVPGRRRLALHEASCLLRRLPGTAFEVSLMAAVEGSAQGCGRPERRGARGGDGDDLPGARDMLR